LKLSEAPIIAANKSLIRANAPLNARYLETDARCAFSSTTPPGPSPLALFATPFLLTSPLGDETIGGWNVGKQYVHLFR